MARLAAATSALVFATVPVLATTAAATTQIQFGDRVLFFPFHAEPEASPASGVTWVDEQIRHLLALPSNWDGYGAEPVSRAQVQQIADIVKEHFSRGLPTGSLVPGADGSIQLEWHLASASFGMSVEPNGSFYAWHRSRSVEQFIEAEGVHAVTLLEACVLQALL